MKGQIFYRRGICVRGTESDDEIVLERLSADYYDSPAGMMEFC